MIVYLHSTFMSVLFVFIWFSAVVGNDLADQESADYGLIPISSCLRSCADHQTVCGFGSASGSHRESRDCVGDDVCHSGPAVHPVCHCDL